MSRIRAEKQCSKIQTCLWNVTIPFDKGGLTFRHFSPVFFHFFVRIYSPKTKEVMQRKDKHRVYDHQTQIWQILTFLGRLPRSVPSRQTFCRALQTMQRQQLKETVYEPSAFTQMQKDILSAAKRCNRHATHHWWLDNCWSRTRTAVCWEQLTSRSPSGSGDVEASLSRRSTESHWTDHVRGFRPGVKQHLVFRIAGALALKNSTLFLAREITEVENLRRSHG